jgi:hypothetical protein
MLQRAKSFARYVHRTTARMAGPAAKAYAGRMSEAEELRRLAERYLDLWERQAALISGAAAGPEAFALWLAALGASGAEPGENGGPPRGGSGTPNAGAG